MSMHIELRTADYKRIMSWFELAFGKKLVTPSDLEMETFRKLSVMSQEMFRKEEEFNDRYGHLKD